ncbi:Uncharacterised protein (plasmid) [Tsukamurella tyrosinosolvens]|uniref:Uncharacterized protein n=1 Tax=Tsukamurella tyrosinosolvens TaxID=57704 RepID=A0A1H4UAX4_TSUTY|nr:hypothetical protein [Tsukamurella tyrosinosolvens]SEC65354.1 hypothetical protein SAMN04489793_2823 [Tsukamurella tyrosinosolvens]VEH94073.1 Uncharacterised protein [Tsukamurella tyrosinosolvens]
MANIHTGPMWLVYRSDTGKYFAQLWGEVPTAGGLIDPDTGDDLEVVGWTTNADDAAAWAA